LAAVDAGVVGAAAEGADVAGVVALVVALEFLLELPQAAASNATAATTRTPAGRDLPVLIRLIRGHRVTRALVIRRTL
jgi:hypothetical protein